ncbi:MAG: helix-turn-helix transcriptional regulator [Flavitalea sp.]
MLQEELNRFDRTLAILIMLQSKKLVRAQEIADHFGVSLRTVYRDIKSLEAAGVPVIGEAGAGYTIMEGYRLPPVMFTKEEAGSFVAAEKLMQKFTDAGLGRYFESAMNKVKSVLKGNEKEWVAALEKQVWAEPSGELFNKDVPNAL